MQRHYSIRQRLLVSAGLLMLVFLGLLALGLSKAFNDSLLANAEDSLRNQILLLISNIDLIEKQIVVPEVLSEARLTQVDGSLFAQISDVNESVVWRSPSLLDRSLPSLNAPMGDFKFFADQPLGDQSKVHATVLNIEWESEQGITPFTVTVAEKVDDYQLRLIKYQQQVFVWLLILAASLLTLLWVLWSWALRPLERVTQQVTQVEQGKRDRFDEDYPREISGLTSNLNQLLNSEQKRINRQKEVLGNLAHSLKTPLAVLNGLNYSSENKADVSQQLDAVNKIIEYQLQSASAVGRRRFAKAIAAGDAVQQVVASLNKIYAEKRLKVAIDVPSGVKFYGDSGDWLELVGNLVENAYKWSNSSLRVQVRNSESKSHRPSTILIVEDDGPGIEPELKELILQRGVRLDSQSPGHGLGLHIVKGIIEAYEGELQVSDVKPNGSRFTALLN